MLRGSTMASAFGGASTPTASVTTVADDLAIDFTRIRLAGGGGVGDESPSGGQTQLDEIVSPISASWSYHSSYKAATTTTTTLTWTPATDSAWNSIGVAVVPSSGGGGSTWVGKRKLLLGVG